MKLLALVLLLAAPEAGDCTKPPKDLPKWIGDEQVQKLILSSWNEDEAVSRQVLSPLETHPEAGPFLEELLRQIESKDTGVRTRAKATGGAILVYSAILALQRGDATVREMAIGVLSEGGANAAPSLSRCLDDDKPDHRLWALHALAYFEEYEFEALVPRIRELLSDDSPKIREAARSLLR